MASPQPPVLYPAPGQQGPVLYLNPYTGAYTESRAYGLRMQRGFAAGLPQTVARRGVASTGLSESEQRRLRFLERYGFEERLWQYLWRKYIREINKMSAPSAQITRQIVGQVLQNSGTTGLGIEFLDQRLGDKLNDMNEYREQRHGGPGTTGRRHWDEGIMERQFTPIELWWYH